MSLNKAYTSEKNGTAAAYSQKNKADNFYTSADLTQRITEIAYIPYKVDTYYKLGKIHWAKLSRFSGIPCKFFCEYKRLSLIILNNEHFWARQHKNISVKTSMALKP